jgi:pimeloyl-ACP methyl ester carboxylesterase
VSDSSGRTYTVQTSHAQVVVADTGGPGTPVVLIHGNSLGKESFNVQLNTFGKERRLIAVDLPGHGGSSDAYDPALTYSLAGYADCLSGMLEAIGIEAAVVVGWSLGGHIGLEMTERYPGLVGLMALGAPPFERRDDGTLIGFKPNPKLALSGAGKLSDSEIAEFARLITDFETPAEIWLKAIGRTDPLALQTMFACLSKQPPRRQKELAECCPVPLALVNGGKDPFVDVDYITRLTYKNLWSGRTWVLEACRHAPHLHAPAGFDAILRRSVADTAPLKVSHAGMGPPSR